MVINVNHIVLFFDTVTKMLQYIHVHSVYCLKSNQIVFYFACYTIWTGMQGSIFLQQMLMVQWQRRSREPWLYWLSNQGPAALLTGWVTIHLLIFTCTVHGCPLAMYLLVLVTCKFVFWVFFIWDSMLLPIFNWLSILLISLYLHVYVCLFVCLSTHLFFFSFSVAVVVVFIYKYQDSTHCVVFTCRLNLDRNDFNHICTCGDNVVLLINLLMLLNCVNCRKMQHETIQPEFHLTYNLYLYHFTAALKINFSRTWFIIMII